MTRDEYITYLAEKVASEEIDFIRVRQELQRHGLNEIQIGSMIRLIDNEVRSQHETVAKSEMASSYTWVGGLMTIAGLIGSTFFMTAGPVVFFVGYGPFATGLGLIVAGRRARLRTFRGKNHRVGNFRSRLKV